MSVKYKFGNLGPVKGAELSLGDLTIIGGANNSGKTYITYALYSLLQYMEERIPDIGNKQEVEKFLAEYSFIINANEGALEGIKVYKNDGSFIFSAHREIFLSFVNGQMRGIYDRFSESELASFFSAKGHYFKDADVYCELVPTDQDDELIEQQFSIIGQYAYNASTKTIQVALNKHWSTCVTRIMQEEGIKSPYGPCVYLIIIAFLNGYFFNEPFILSSERFGISLFYKELDANKSTLVDAIQKMRDNGEEPDENYLSVIDRYSSRYAKPIKDNIDFARDLEEVQKGKGALSESRLFSDIRDMMEAYYRYSNYGINFISTKRNGFKIPLHLASSSARGLSDLYFYLRHKAGKGKLLIIDEPESHLDPENQIKMARQLVRCVNAGLKVLITTHSDYMIKEFNNLVMLSSDFEGKADFLHKYRKHYREEDHLAQDRIKGYLCQKGTLVSCDVNEYGIQMENFDNAIKSMNKISNTLGLLVENRE